MESIVNPKPKGKKTKKGKKGNGNGNGKGKKEVVAISPIKIEYGTFIIFGD